MQIILLPTDGSCLNEIIITVILSYLAAIDSNLPTVLHHPTSTWENPHTVETELVQLAAEEDVEPRFWSVSLVGLATVFHSRSGRKGNPSTQISEQYPEGLWYGGTPLTAENNVKNKHLLASLPRLISAWTWAHMITWPTLPFAEVTSYKEHERAMTYWAPKTQQFEPFEMRTRLEQDSNKLYTRLWKWSSA